MSTRSILRSFLTVIFVVSALMLISSTLDLAKAERPPHSSIITCLGSIQACIDAASDGDTIVIPEGTYTESLTLSKPVSLTGVNSTTTIIHAVEGQRVLTVTGATIGNSVVISGLTFTGGSADYGGGIALLNSAQPLIDQVRIANNQAAFSGGGIYADQSSPLVLNQAIVISNTAEQYHGGGLASWSWDPVTIMNSRFENNQCVNCDGGGLYTDGTETKTLALSNTVFINNVATAGGGLFVDNRSPLTLHNIQFISNTVNLDGGGLFTQGFLTLIDGQFIGNVAAGDGGGLYAGTAQITRTQFINNVASAATRPYGLGGGAKVEGWVIITDGRFEGNVSHGENGGGLYASSFIVTNTDFISNAIDGWGGGASGGDAAIYGGRFERNTSGGNGGALSVNNLYITGALIISNTSNVNNNAPFPGGGGIFIVIDGTVVQSRIENNQCLATRCNGGGILLWGQSRIANALLNNNAADVDGAAVAIDALGEHELLHLTIADSTINAQSAIAILRGTLHLTDTIIASHTIGISNTGGTVYEDYNLFSGNITNTIGVTSGSHSLVGDPMFVDPLNDNYHLRLGSPAIDHGVDAGVYTDLDGDPRPIGSGFDIGAYEFVGGTRYVATTGADNSNNCLAEANPCATVQHAIDVANAGEQVLIASGLYTESATLYKPVSLTGVNSTTTIIHAVEGQRVLTVTGATITNSVVISGLTFTGGNVANGFGYPFDCGGGLLIIDSASPVLQHLNVISNTADEGGGLYATNALKIAGSKFERNLATGSCGGSACVADLLVVTLIDTDFINNSAAAGGGMRASSVIVNGGRFEGNYAVGTSTGNSGGGIDCLELDMTDTIFINNSAAIGGGVHSAITSLNGGRFEGNISDTGGGVATNQLWMSGTQFMSNTSVSGGGGVWIAGGPVTIIGGRFENNRTIHNQYGHGGAVRADMYAQPGQLFITGTQFISNAAAATGGGLFYTTLDYDNITARVVNTVFARNSAGSDGAALSMQSATNLDLLHASIADIDLNPKSAIAVLGSTINLTDTIITSHTIGISNTGGTVYEDYNLFSGNLTNTVGVTSGGHSLIGDPKFVDPLNDDYHLRIGSPAIDHGIDVGVYTDLDGNPRPRGSGFDIGAYEYQGPIIRVYLPVVLK